MIADVIKLVRLGALVFVLLPMMDWGFANADPEIIALNDDDTQILTQKLHHYSFLQPIEIKGLLEKVTQRDGAKIDGVSVTEILSLTLAKDCEEEELIGRSKITLQLTNHLLMHGFAKFHLREYVKRCFNDVAKVKSISDAMTSSLNTVRNFQQEILDAERKESGYRSYSWVADKYKDGPELQGVKDGCKTISDNIIMLKSIYTCLMGKGASVYNIEPSFKGEASGYNMEHTAKDEAFMSSTKVSQEIKTTCMLWHQDFDNVLIGCV